MFTVRVSQPVMSQTKQNGWDTCSWSCNWVQSLAAAALVECVCCGQAVLVNDDKTKRDLPACNNLTTDKFKHARQPGRSSQNRVSSSSCTPARCTLLSIFNLNRTKHTALSNNLTALQNDLLLLLLRPLNSSSTCRHGHQVGSCCCF
jgi:hypothetical protein